jgi:hypothetical protein
MLGEEEDLKKRNGIMNDAREEEDTKPRSSKSGNKTYPKFGHCCDNSVETPETLG